MKVTITSISRKDRVSQKTGKPFVSLGLKTQEHGDKWLSGFDGKQTRDWKVGDTVEIDVEQKGEYLNFSVPKLPEGYALPSDLTERLNLIETKIDRILGFVVKADIEKETGGEPPF